MLKMKSSRIIILFIVLVLACIVFFARLDEVVGVIEEIEVREYQGEDLSSIDDFRENSISGPQFVDVQNYSLVVEGLVENELEFGYVEVVDGFESMKKVVTLYCVEGWNVRLLWEGVLLSDILDLADVRSDASVVIFHAYDGYTTSLPLEYILDNRIIMAYKMNNVTLPPQRGFPFQLVAESKYGYKWIKWITKIELSNNEEYKGYWETRGYSNSAKLPPILNPTPTQQPTNTPNPTPSSDEETNLLLEIGAVGIAAIAVVVIVLLYRRK
jgi:hypothetical protein